mmetsp:Transcript_71839/g.206239  ORF Transcript_71839/g.206239 Transcript_71839/m.206239 type:complete len:466 (-) Transcript_71839:252-1649(-)
MYHMASELLEEMPCHFALFACGAVGWGLTRWANMRFGTDRQAVQPLKAKLLETEETEEVEEPMAAEGTPMEAEEEEVMPVTQTNPISPAAGAAARRRANRRKGRDQPLAARGAACEEVDAPAVAVEEAIIEVPITLVGKAKDEEDLVPPCSTRPVRAASVEEPEPEVVPPTPSSAFPLLEQSIDEPESVPADEAPEVSHGVSERVAKLLAKKAERKVRKADEKKQQSEEEQRQQELQKEAETVAAEGQAKTPEAAAQGEQDEDAGSWEEPDREPRTLSCGGANEVSGPAPQWTEQPGEDCGPVARVQTWAVERPWAEEEEECSWEGGWSEAPAVTRAWTEPAPARARLAMQAPQSQDGWDLPLDEMPQQDEDFDACDVSMVQALPRHVPAHPLPGRPAALHGRPSGLHARGLRGDGVRRRRLLGGGAPGGRSPRPNAPGADELVHRYDPEPLRLLRRRVLAHLSI